MKKKYTSKKYLLFSTIAILMLLVFFIPKQSSAVDWGRLGKELTETIRGSAKDHPIKIDMGMVYMRDPNPIVSDSTEMATTNFYPRFTIYNFEKNKWPKTVEEGQEIVYRRIHGIAVFNVQTLYNIKLFTDKAKTASPQITEQIKDYIIVSVAQAVKYDEAKPIEDKYIVIHTDYYSYVEAKKEAEKLIAAMKLITYLTGELPSIKYEGYFYPGLAFSEQYTKPEALAEVKDFINKQSANPNDGYWVTPGWANYTGDTITEVRRHLIPKNNDYVFINKDQYSVINKFLANNSYSTGACFEIKPVGQRNLCTTTIQSKCKVNYTRNPSSETTSQVMFTPGLICEHLASIFAYVNSMALDTDSTAYQEKIAGAALKEATLFEPQVPFAGIKSGITLTDYINEIYKYLMGFALFISGAMLVFGGAKYMLGHKDSIAIMRNAFIGVLLLSTTYIILKTINPQMTNLSNIEISTLNRVTLAVPTAQTAATGLGTASSPLRKFDNVSKLVGCSAPLNDIIAGCVDLRTSEKRITDPTEMANLAKKFTNQYLDYVNSSFGVNYLGNGEKGSHTNEIMRSEFPKDYIKPIQKNNTFVGFKKELGVPASTGKTGISCIGYIQAFYACIGRPVYTWSAAALLYEHGQLINDIVVSSDKKSITINGKELKTGDVIGWVGWAAMNSTDLTGLRARQLVETLGGGPIIKSTTANSRGEFDYEITLPRKVNGKDEKIQHKILRVSHVVLYLGNGEFMDWGYGDISKIGTPKEKQSALVADISLKYHSFVIFLNDLETDSYNQQQASTATVKSCKQLWDKIQSDPKNNVYYLDKK